MEEIKEEIKNEVIEEIMEEIKSMYVLLNEDNRISMVTKDKQSEEQFEFVFPNDFDFSSIASWKIVNEELVYDKLPIPEHPHEPTAEERIAELEEQLLMTDEIAVELYESQMIQEEVNIAQDEALVEIFELIENL